MPRLLHLPGSERTFHRRLAPGRGGIGSLASAFSKVIADLVCIEETHQVSAGSVFEACGNHESHTYLYGSKEILNWMKKHPYKKLARVARRLTA